MTPEIKDVLMSAHEEIISLRRRVADLEPKAEAYSALVTVIGFIQGNSAGYGVDAAWQIKQLLEADSSESESA